MVHLLPKQVLHCLVHFFDTKAILQCSSLWPFVLHIPEPFRLSRFHIFREVLPCFHLRFAFYIFLYQFRKVQHPPDRIPDIHSKYVQFSRLALSLRLPVPIAFLSSSGQDFFPTPSVVKSNAYNLHIPYGMYVRLEYSVLLQSSLPEKM